MNRAINPAAAEQGRICSIHNGIDFELRDVTKDNVDFANRFHFFTHPNDPT